jgi:hypothetical protein
MRFLLPSINIATKVYVSRGHDETLAVSPTEFDVEGSVTTIRPPRRNKFVKTLRASFNDKTSAN